MSRRKSWPPRDGNTVVVSVRMGRDAVLALKELSRDLDLTKQKTTELAILRLARERREGKVLGVELVATHH